MFDLRYHVASLAAVFLALILGILVGVGISDRGLVETFERSALEARVDALEGRLEAAERRARQQQAAETVIRDAAPVLMHDRLRGKKIGLVFVGSVDPRVRTSVEQALREAGAPGVTRMRALRIPFDEKAVSAAVSARPLLARYRGRERLDELGAALAREFVRGGETPLWDSLSSHLVEERAGGGRAAVDAVVVSGSVARPRGAPASFLGGFQDGLAAGREPVVGVEASTAEPSSVAVYRRAGLSSVDAVETPTGRLALVLLLAGGLPGHYGLKGTADDGILPPIEPVSVARAPGA